MDIKKRYSTIIISLDGYILLLNNKATGTWNIITGRTTQKGMNEHIKYTIMERTGIHLGTYLIRKMDQIVILNKGCQEYNIKLSPNYTTYVWVSIGYLYNMFNQIKFDHRTHNHLWNYLWSLTDTKKSYGAVLKSSDDKILIIQEKASGLWGVPKGKKKIGETETQCIMREVMEEVGIKLQLRKQYTERCPLIRLRRDHTMYNIQIQPTEIIKYEWVDMGQISRVLTERKFNMLSSKALIGVI